MHPALSIIAFSTLSGLGYGLAAVLGLGILDAGARATVAAHVLALGLIASGLAASTLHLGNPTRAWRAFSQWRSSWLSREAVAAVLAFIPVSATAGFSVFRGESWPVLGVLGALMALGTVYCTAMIYASLRAVEAWHTPLTPLCYLLFAVAGGFVSATPFAIAGAGPGSLCAGLGMAMMAAAAIAKLFWRYRANTLRPRSTPETATGLGAIGKVRLFERPHGNDNYLTREMGYRVARKHAAKLAAISLMLCAAFPILCLALVLGAGQGAVALALSVLAAVSHAAGMLVERWLFFAEARHTVMNYY